MKATVTHKSLAHMTDGMHRISSTHLPSIDQIQVTDSEIVVDLEIYCKRSLVELVLQNFLTDMKLSLELQIRLWC